MMEYRYAFSLTSQFYFCGLPLRLDSYSRCQFNCAYCFAAARGGFRGAQGVGAANVAQFRRRLERIDSGSAHSVIDELLAHNQPIHFGGVSDPFSELESKLHTSLSLLRALADRQYPTIISTKGTLMTENEYLDVLKRGKFVVQVSMSSMDASLLAKIDMGTAGPRALLRAAELLCSEGIPVACRIQPLLPTRESDAFEVIDECASVGIKHVAVEHLKLPIETSWWGTKRLSTALKLDLSEYYRNRSSKRVGREWILPVGDRLQWCLALREHAHARGLSFGAADNDLLLLSDGDCCCSGVDLFGGFQSFFRFNYPEAVRRCVDRDDVTIRSLNGIWCPSRSISQYVSSHSRLGSIGKSGPGIRNYIKNSWNGSPNGNSPGTLFGVVDKGVPAGRKYRVYSVTDEMRTILKSRLSQGNSYVSDRNIL